MKKIKVGNGPEDMLLDKVDGVEQLIISCGDFARIGQPDRSGSIHGYNLQTESGFQFETDGMALVPHSIAIRRSRRELYVIHHGGSGSQPAEHSVFVFAIEGHKLSLKKSFASSAYPDYLTTPNDIHVLDDGSFYLTNDGGYGAHAAVNRLFRATSNVVYYDANRRSFRRVVSHLGAANGIFFEGGKLFVADGLKRNLLVYDVAKDGSVTTSVPVRVSRFLDNVTPVGNRKLLIPSHTNPCKLLRHMKSPASVRSPFAVYEVDTASGGVREVMHHDGSLISAVSTVVAHNGSLYLSQIAGNFLLKIPYPNDEEIRADS